MELGELRNIRVNVEIDEALGILKRNLAKHKKEHEKALKGWHKKVASMAAKVAKSAKANKLTSKARNDLARLLSQQPQSYAAAYEASIDMFGHHMDATISLNSSDYDKLMRDNWDWMDSFKTTNSMYLGKR